jgi:hypothetical protein
MKIVGVVGFHLTLFWSNRAMARHKFRIGQLVQLAPAVARNVRGGTYEVTKQLPENRGGFEYRIKNSNEPHERVVRESELREE